MPTQAGQSTLRLTVCASILGFASLFWMAGCGDKEVQSTWVRAPLTIDGKLDDWKDAPSVVFDDEHFGLSVENDSAYLYVSGRTSDAAVAQAIGRIGITLWVDPEGGSNKDLEIRFPVGRAADFRQARGGFWESLTDDQRKRASNEMDEVRKGMLVIDNRSITSRTYPARGATGFAAGVGESSGITSFEVRIPINLQEYFSELNSLGAKGKVGVGVGFGGVQKDPRDYAGRVGQGMGGRGGGGRGGFGMPPRRGQSGESSSEIWAEVKLASAK